MAKKRDDEAPEGELVPVKLLKVVQLDDVVYRPTLDPEVDAHVDQETLKRLRDAGGVK